MTESMTKSLWETYRRRNIQNTFNIKHGITPEKALSNIKSLEAVKTGKNLEIQDFGGLTRGKTKRLKKATKKEQEMIKKDLRSQLDDSIAKRDFEKAAFLRDQLQALE